MLPDFLRLGKDASCNLTIERPFYIVCSFYEESCAISSLSTGKSHFGSKEQLQLATVGAAKQIFLEQVVKPGLTSPRGVPRLKVMLESWLGYVERIVFRGGCFFAAASAEFDSRPGKVRDDIASLSKAWLDALQGEIAFARKRKEIKASVVPSQLAFELHAYVQEANWAFKLFDDKSAFLRARRAISDRLAESSVQ